MLDINLLRRNPELLRESQRNRFGSVQLVDDAIDNDWARRKRQFELDKIRQELNAISKRVGKLKAGKREDETMKQQEEEEARMLMESTNEVKERLAAKEAEVQEIAITLYAKLMAIGNIVHKSVIISNDEADNAIVQRWGEQRFEENLKNHVDLCRRLAILELEKGVNVAGGRCYFLKGMGVRLNRALINLALDFLGKRGFEEIQTPFFMRKEVMAKCAQLAQFDEELYKLGIPYRVVSIVSGALNDAAAKKYDLEGWFPASQTYRELVSCSNCTDYQARRLGIRYGQKNDKADQFVHILNSTLVATERTLCCILENYQTEDGVQVPKALQPYMGGIEFLPFKQP
ncbi:hypothetical protein QOZ80_3BG0290640 [Eleusine coracana subsp. coracana]|nr:hypothetical protein QOZ80_3BG0290640 [Eleusine coracana subsp. coracana]